MYTQSMRTLTSFALASLLLACAPEAHVAEGADAGQPPITADAASSVEDASPPSSPDAYRAPRDAFVAPPDDGGVAPIELGDPIDIAPADRGRWVWVTIPEMICGDGNPGGVAVNFTDASRDLVIYLQGGGICYDSLTCSVGGAPKGVGATPLTTALDGSIREGRGIFNRGDATNPFRDSSFVVVPHCTGDHHTGNAVGEYGIAGGTWQHRGYANITRMLERVVPTFRDASRVVLSGFSAGGVGISANYHQIARAFESVGQPPPYLVIDAGPFLRPPFLEASAQRTLRERWRLDDTIGSFCPSCLEAATDGGFHELYRVNAELHPGLRASLVCAYGDSVVRTLYGVLNGRAVSADRLKEGLRDVAAWRGEGAAATAPGELEFFFYGGERHGALNVAPLSDTPGIATFLAGQLGEGAWPSVIP